MVEGGRDPSWFPGLGEWVDDRALEGGRKGWRKSQVGIERGCTKILVLLSLEMSAKHLHSVQYSAGYLIAYLRGLYLWL